MRILFKSPTNKDHDGVREIKLSEAPYIAYYMEPSEIRKELDKMDQEELIKVVLEYSEILDYIEDATYRTLIKILAKI